MYTENQRTLDVLEAGQRILLRSGSEEYAGTACRVLSDGSQLKAVATFAPDCAPVPSAGSEVAVSFTKTALGRSYLYSFTAKVFEVERGEDGPVTVVLVLPGSLTRREHRASCRIAVSVGGKFIPRDGRSDERPHIPFFTKDFSAGGARVVVADMLEVGETGSVEIDLPDSSLPTLACEVVRSERLDDGQCIASLRFLDMTPEVEDRICALMREWERGLRALKGKGLVQSDNALLRFLFGKGR